MAFPPDLTEKPRPPPGSLKKGEHFYLSISMCCENSSTFFPFRRFPFELSKLMPRLGGHICPYRTATTMNEDGAEAVEQVFKP
jgi:hypothetical protein